MAKRPARVEVFPRRNESTERLIKRFIKKVKKERIIEQVRDLQYYEKPSVTRNRIKRRKRRITKE